MIPSAYNGLLLDDPPLRKWQQTDWLSWLDLMASGVTAAGRYSNSPLTKGLLRGICSNLKPDDAWDKFTPGERDAIEEKGNIINFWSESLQKDMRLSTWFRDKAGKPAPCLLTEEGERVFRQYMGIATPEATRTARSSGSGASISLNLSPGTYKRVMDSLSPATSAKVARSE